MQYYLNAREWLETQRLRTDRVGDFAAEIADRWIPDDEIDECQEIRDAREEADQAEAKLAAIECAIDGSPLAREYVTTGTPLTGSELKHFLNEVQDMEIALREIRKVLERCGVLAAGDEEADLAAILVMFVPPA